MLILVPQNSENAHIWHEKLTMCLKVKYFLHGLEALYKNVRYKNVQFLCLLYSDLVYLLLI